jgi:putative transposase
MSKKRHTKGAQIKAIRDHEAGRTQAEGCKELNITAQTFYRWKKQLGMMTTRDVRRLKELQKENKELTQMMADGLLRERNLRIVVEKTLSPRVLREIYARHPQLGRLNVKAILNRRLLQEGRPLMGLRLVQRLRRRLCPCVPPPKRKRVRKGLTAGRMPTKATKPRGLCTWDFQADIKTVGGTFRILALIDEYTKRCGGHDVVRSIRAQDVMRTLAQAISEHGAHERIRSDNGPEFIATASPCAASRPSTSTPARLAERLHRAV